MKMRNGRRRNPQWETANTGTIATTSISKWMVSTTATWLQTKENPNEFPPFPQLTAQALSKWQIQYANYDGDVGDWNSLPHASSKGKPEKQEKPDPLTIDNLDHCSALVRMTCTSYRNSIPRSGQERPADWPVDVERPAHDVQAAQDLRPASAAHGVGGERDHSGPADGVQHVPGADQQRRRLLHGGRVDGGAGDDDRELQRGAVSVYEREERDAVGAEPDREPAGAVEAWKRGEEQVAGGVVQVVRDV